MGSTKIHLPKRVGQYKIRSPINKKKMIAQNDKNRSDNSDIKQNTSDFSIEHILHRAGSSASSSASLSSNLNVCHNFEDKTSLDLHSYPWLQCTRYCPPKIPRTQRKDVPQKRQLGRHPRIPFTSHQLSVLEEKFQKSAYLSSEEVIVLSRQLHLADVRVKIWFQNRRARQRREKLMQNSDNTSTRENQSNAASSSSNLHLSNINADSVQPSTGVYNFFPVHSLLHNQLENYLGCVSQLQYSSNGKST